MSKGSPSPPPTYSPSEIASAQGQSNIATAGAQSALNNTNVVSPYGSTTYAQTGSYATPYGSVPTYTQTQSLSPLGQALYTGEGGIAQRNVGTGQALADEAGRSALNPLDFNTAFSSYLNRGPQQQDQQAANAIYQEQKGFLDPRFSQGQTDLQDQLSRQGIPVGSDAYNRAMTNFDTSKNQAYQAAQDAATAGGAQSANNLFNLALQGQNQNISQQQLAQQNPIDLLSSILGTTPQFPGAPSTSPAQTAIQGNDVTGAYNSSAQQAQARYQAQLQQQNAMFGGLGSILGTLGSAAIFASDRQLKTDIEPLGRTIANLPLYSFRYTWEAPTVRHIGVMADEAEQLYPDAVFKDRDGFKLVDYSRLG